MIAAGVSGSIKELPVTSVDGKLMHFYEVQPKETIYSLSNKLEISRDYLIECNPDVKDGLKAFSILYFPIDPSENNPGTMTHIVKKGETIYGLSKALGISSDMLIAQNPQLADGLKVGQTVTVTLPGNNLTPANIHSTSTTSKESGHPDTGSETYIVREGETFYSIARAHGISVAILEDANPNIGVLKAGDTLIIPSDLTSTTPPAKQQASTITETSSAEVTAPTIQHDNDGINTPATDPEVRIAVMLPFMLSQTSPDKAAQRFTEFYKGLLIAVDTLKTANKPIKIYAYDTAGSSDTIKAILNSHPELKNMQVIIGPDNEAQLNTIGRWGHDNGIMVFNVFSVKDDSQLSNPAMMQGNIPHQKMSQYAIDAFLRRNPDHTIVILHRKDGPSDKNEFIGLLTETSTRQGRSVKTIEFNDRLKTADLEILPQEGHYLFVTTSGRQAELNKVLPALVDLKETAVMPDDVTLAGYPEWITFRGETLTNMQALNTTVYTRFFEDTESTDSRQLEASFRRWFGSTMDNAIPRQGTLGFDTGMYLINALRHNHGNFSNPTPVYNGIQSGFEMIPATANGGLTNNKAYIVTFRPAGIVEKTEL